MRKRIASLFLALLVCVGLTVPALADVEANQTGLVSGAYTYQLNSDGSATIVSFNKNWTYGNHNKLETLNIPASLDGHPVTAIAGYAFTYYMPGGTKHIVIPEGVKCIESDAFVSQYMGASNEVVSIDVPSTVTYIGDGAFSNQAALRQFTCRSKDVQITGSNVFYGVYDCTFYGYPDSTFQQYVDAMPKTYQKQVTDSNTYTVQWVDTPTNNTFRNLSAASDAKPAAPAFTDVAASAYYAAPVEWAVGKGITTGTTATTFSPNSTCTRAQIITFLYRATGSDDGGGVPVETGRQSGRGRRRLHRRLLPRSGLGRQRRRHHRHHQHHLRPGQHLHPGPDRHLPVPRLRGLRFFPNRRRCFGICACFFVKLANLTTFRSSIILFLQFQTHMDDTCSALHVNLITDQTSGSESGCGGSPCVFLLGEKERFMPQTPFQRKIFALLTVIFTVHAYVFYSLYVLNGSALVAVSGQASVLGAIRAMGGVYMCGRSCPIWAVVLVEFVFAYTLELLMGNPLSFRLARKCFDPRTTHPVLFETAIISATVGLMCPSMSLIATFLYFPYYDGFHLLTALAEFVKHVCFNFPFAFFSQLFFIQPLVRTLFRILFRNRLSAAQG